MQTPTAVTDPSAGPAPKPGRARGRALAGLGAVVVLAAAAAGAVAMRDTPDGGTSPEGKAPLFTSSTRVVTYEVAGEGPVEEITYVVGAGNRLETVTNPELPWSSEVTVEVGHAGGNALVNAANAGAGKLSCGVEVGGAPVYQVTGQAETDVSCSAELPAATAPAG